MEEKGLESEKERGWEVGEEWTWKRNMVCV